MPTSAPRPSRKPNANGLKPNAANAQTPNAQTKAKPKSKAKPKIKPKADARGASASQGAKVKASRPNGKAGVSKALHPRSAHLNGYDFPALIAAYPELKPWVRPTPYGALSIDFADAQAVKTLNAALLTHHYGVQNWDIPQGALCPPIPGRVDYLHYLADLLAEGEPLTAL
ncbi:MAG: RlmF-related methyltransferase, partial [Shewanella sp.]